MTPETARAVLLAGCLALLAGCASQPKPEPVVVNTSEASELVRQAWEAHQQGRTNEALERYREAFSLNPGNALTANNLALLLREQGRFDEAVMVLEAGLRNSPATSELHYNLAVISELYLLDLDGALAHYRRYRELADSEEKQVAGWIADLERRLD
jgi:tetratricopeptide (TPR) repeat protein